ncbi:MAG: PD-(D/E)XK nuclease family protein [Tannerella sp.]|nr:PD-(D/E)XK nuclease family protein [Tannerella sp.]
MYYDIKNGLDFIHKVIAQETENVCQVFDFLSKFKVASEKAASKFVYHINVIDELHVNENAHSRILAKLLQQNVPESKRFEILERFVQFLQKKKPDSFGNITVEQPDITQETARIDLWIRDKNYAVIVENKICWAGDQPTQIERYIDTTRSYGYAETQIYVVYLSPVCDKEPDRQSWGKYYDSEIHRERYVQLSFREDILLWLKDDILPNVRIKDTYLRSAIEQYIDHLEGIFDLRTINKEFNMELQEFIKKELGLDGTPQENVTKLVAKQEELNKVNSQLQLLKDEAEKAIFREWQSTLDTGYPDYKLVAEEGTRAGILIPVADKTVRVSISFDNQLYCQVDLDHLVGTEKILPESVIAKVEHILTRKNNNGQIWKYFPRYAYNDVYKCLMDVIEILTK